VPSIDTFNKDYSSNNNFPWLFKDFSIKYSFPWLLKASILQNKIDWFPNVLQFPALNVTWIILCPLSALSLAATSGRVNYNDWIIRVTLNSVAVGNQILENVLLAFEMSVTINMFKKMGKYFSLDITCFFCTVLI
jgi:hypothetical protein